MPIKIINDSLANITPAFYTAYFYAENQMRFKEVFGDFINLFYK